MLSAVQSSILVNTFLLSWNSMHMLNFLTNSSTKSEVSKMATPAPSMKKNAVIKKGTLKNQHILYI